MRRQLSRSILSAIGLSAGLLLITFIVTNFRQDAKIRGPLSATCNCPSLETRIERLEKLTVPNLDKSDARKTIAVNVDTTTTTTATPLISATTTTTLLPELPPCKHVSKESPVQRAILIYYPHHQSEYFFPEIRW
jgi:hypothetical protein